MQAREVKKLYYSIGEISQKTGLKQYVLRYWEKEFETLEPTKRRGNRRYYTQDDILTIIKINNLISTQGFTIDGAKQNLASSISKSDSKENLAFTILKKDIQKIIDVLEK